LIETERVGSLDTDLIAARRWYCDSHLFRLATGKDAVLFYQVEISSVGEVKERFLLLALLHMILQKLI